MTLDGNKTLGGLTFSNSSGGNYFITATDTSTLTLNNLGSDATVAVAGGGTHYIDVPVVLASNMAFSADAGSNLIFTTNAPSAAPTR